MYPTGKQFIGYTSSQSGKRTFDTLNPSTLEGNGYSFSVATRDELTAVVQKAESAFYQYAKTSAQLRSDFLRLIALKLENNQGDLCALFSKESGLPADRAILELNRTIFQLNEFAALLSNPNWNLIATLEADLDRKPIPRPSLIKKHVPIGPVLVFGASNFPFAYSTIGGDTASALAAGCSVIVKAHPFHAGTSDLVAQLVVESAKEMNLPDGVFSHVFDDTFESGTFLMLQDQIKAVGFTGSFQGGKALMDLSNKRQNPIPVFAEMGSCNPVFIFPQKMKSTENLAQIIASSISLNAGQFCTNPGLIFVLKSTETEKWIESLVKLLEHVTPQVMLHPSIFNRYMEQRDKVTKHTDYLVEPKNLSCNNFMPTLVRCSVEDFLRNEVIQEEVFGSFSVIVELTTVEEFNQCLHELKGQLTCSIFAEDDEVSSDFLFLASQKAGRIVWNGVPTGVEVSEAMTHGGPYPATSDSRFTAVGKHAILRFLRPVSFQNFSSALEI